MTCPFKIECVNENHRMDGDVEKQYFYQECAMTGCVAWQETLQDCRLALGGMERVTQNINGGGERYNKASTKRLQVAWGIGS